MSFKEM